MLLVVGIARYKLWNYCMNRPKSPAAAPHAEFMCESCSCFQPGEKPQTSRKTNEGLKTASGSIGIIQEPNGIDGCFFRGSVLKPQQGGGASDSKATR